MKHILLASSLVALAYSSTVHAGGIDLPPANQDTVQNIVMIILAILHLFKKPSQQ